MQWEKGYTSKYYMTLVDPDSWGDTDTIKIIDGSIKFELTGLRCSADVTCDDFDFSEEKIVRIWLDAKQDGSSGSHIPLFTGYASNPNKKIEGTSEKKTLQCYSVLLPCSNILLPRGWYAPLHVNGVTLIRNLLLPANVIVEVDSESEDVVLSNSIVAESKETNLTMIELILDAINWRMVVDGYGVVHLSQHNPSPKASFNSENNDVLETSITIEHDWFNCPNVLRAVLDDQVAVAYDYDSDTPMSIVNRGREIWMEEDNVNLNQNETLHGYAERRLREIQKIATTLRYDRRFVPDIYISDVVSLNYPKQNIHGNYMVSSQSISLEHNARTSEEVMEI